MARPAPDLLAPRIAPASQLTSFGGYQPAVCGHPTGMILTRARTLLQPCFARLLAALVGEPDGFAAGAFHARPLRWQSKSRRARKRALGRQSALRPLRFALVIGSLSLSLRGKARLLPRAASTIRVTMLRRRDTASSPRSRLVSHHANRSLAVPLRLLLARVALPRPSIRRVFFVASALVDVPSTRLTLPATDLPQLSGVVPDMVYYSL